MLKRRTRDEGYSALKPRRLKSYVLTSDAILRIAQDALELVRAVQGARTLAMLAASLQGAVLKVGEDGLSHDLPRRAARLGFVGSLGRICKSSAARRRLTMDMMARIKTLLGLSIAMAALGSIQAQTPKSAHASKASEPNL